MDSNELDFDVSDSSELDSSVVDSRLPNLSALNLCQCSILNPAPSPASPRMLRSFSALRLESRIWAAVWWGFWCGLVWCELVWRLWFGCGFWCKLFLYRLRLWCFMGCLWIKVCVGIGRRFVRQKCAKQTHKSGTQNIATQILTNVSKALHKFCEVHARQRRFAARYLLCAKVQRQR